MFWKSWDGSRWLATGSRVDGLVTDQMTTVDVDEATTPNTWKVDPGIDDAFRFIGILATSTGSAAPERTRAVASGVEAAALGLPLDVALGATPDAGGDPAVGELGGADGATAQAVVIRASSSFDNRRGRIGTS